MSPLATQIESPRRQEVIDILRSSVLFRDISDEILSQLLGYFETKQYEAGEPIFLEQEISDSVFVVLSGSVEIAKYAPQSGGMRRVISFAPGDIFSELSLLAKSNHSTSAFAIEETELLALHRNVFLEILRKIPKVGLNLLNNLALLNRQVLHEKDLVDSYQEGFLQPHPQLTQLVPFAFIEQYQVIPLRFQNGLLLVGLRDPHNLTFFRTFRAQNPQVGLKVCLISEHDFTQLKKSISPLYMGQNVALRLERKIQPTPSETQDAKPPLQCLKDSKNFGMFTLDILQKLLAHSTLKQLSSGEMLYEAGANSDHLYIVLSGQVELRAPQSPGGSRHVAYCPAGEMLAETSLILNSPHNLSARAVNDCQILLISKENFGRLLQMAEFTLSIADLLAKRLQRSNFLARSHHEQKIDFATLPALADLIPHHILKRHRMVPLEINDKVLTLGCVDPVGDNTYPMLHRYVSSFRIELVTITEAIFEECFAAMLRIRRQNHNPKDNLRLVGSDSQNVVARQIDNLIHTAAGIRASDIHLEMQKEGMIFRFRVDGMLQDAFEKVTIETAKHIINRLKVLAKLDIAESRLPQDGRIDMDTIPGTSFTGMRISILPGVFGENAVLRLHRAENAILPLDLLTPNRETVKRLRQISESSQGVVLVAGPTGAGKTSTLYAMLTSLNKSDTNIISVEDPVETVIPGITQISVNTDIGRSYENILRHILRHDPDIIMIGEIRDASSAQIAFEAAVTGHLVLSTVHATDSLCALPRLMELGVPIQTLSSGLNGIISQRLLRCICLECKSSRPIKPAEIKLLSRFFDRHSLPTRVAVGTGCEHCRYTGYFDRLAVFELWQKSVKVHQHLLNESSMTDFINIVRNEEFHSLMEAGLQLVLSGLTTIEEVLRNCPNPPY